jgi:hypothetical protein
VLARRRVPRPPRGFWRRQYEKVRYRREQSDAALTLPADLALPAEPAPAAVDLRAP